MDFYTADLHLFHEAVASMRGFSSTTAHDSHIIDAIVANVFPGDRLIVLGDLCRGEDEVEQTLDVLAEARKVTGAEWHLVSGNHDMTHPLHRKWRDWVPTYSRVFDTITPADSCVLAKTRCVVNHLPYTGDHVAEDRYMMWRQVDTGHPIIHGHTHATTPLSRSAAGTIQVCVSVDAWDFAPVAKQELGQLVSEQINAG